MELTPKFLLQTQLADAVATKPVCKSSFYQVSQSSKSRLERLNHGWEKSCWELVGNRQESVLKGFSEVPGGFWERARPWTSEFGSWRQASERWGHCLWGAGSSRLPGKPTFFGRENIDLPPQKTFKMCSNLTSNYISARRTRCLMRSAPACRCWWGT